MQTTIAVPATIMTDYPARLEWPDFLAATGMETMTANDLLRDVADIIMSADTVLGIGLWDIPDALASKWYPPHVEAAIGYSLTYIGGLTVYRLYDGRVVIIPPKPALPKRSKKNLPPRANIQEINAIMAELNMTPAQLGRALGASTKNASVSVYAWIRGKQKPSPRTTAKLRALLPD
jgi:DNA-binding transcriptional regulator YiaG